MNVDLRFSSQIEQALQARAIASGKDVATIVEEMVAENLTQEASHSPAPEASSILARLREFAHLHPQVDRPLDVRRESIYADRGR